MPNLYTEKIKGQVFLVGEINARKCKSHKKMCVELREAFRWPIGTHCADAMYDLAWHEEQNYKIIVNKFGTLKIENQKEVILDVLNSYKDYWDERQIREKNNDVNNFVIELR